MERLGRFDKQLAPREETPMNGSITGTEPVFEFEGKYEEDERAYVEKLIELTKNDIDYRRWQDRVQLSALLDGRNCVQMGMTRKSIELRGHATDDICAVRPITRISLSERDLVELACNFIDDSLEELRT